MISKKTCLIICAALFAAFTLCLAVSALAFMPRQGVKTAARQAAYAEILTGRDSGEYTAGELLPGELININSADSDELRRLPGIGDALAQAIVEYRTANGRFARIEDIMQVDGIGEGRFAAISENITVKDGSDENSGS